MLLFSSGDQTSGFTALHYHGECRSIDKSLGKRNSVAGDESDSDSGAGALAASADLNAAAAPLDDNVQFNLLRFNERFKELLSVNGGSDMNENPSSGFIEDEQGVDDIQR